jgi:large subunit ribosomal protein L23
MKTFADKIIQPLMSEKSSAKEKSLNEFSLLVDRRLTKIEIAKAVETLFGVKPTQVRTVVFRKKTKQTRYGIIPAKSYKKALVRLPEGKRIEMK